MILSRFVRLFLPNLPCTDKDDTAESRKHRPFKLEAFAGGASWDTCKTILGLIAAMAIFTATFLFMRLVPAS